jgi:hypothetical protein
MNAIHKTIAFLFLPVSLIYFADCAASRSNITDVGQPESPVRELCDKGDYHAAMRELPTAMAQWEQYTKRTGNTCEGTAGFLYVHTMSNTAEKGDLHWAKILDDPDIPYVYKTEMIFEILEARLGKGAVYVANKQNSIVPRLRPIDFDKEKRITLPE